MNINIGVKKLDDRAKLPTRNYDSDLCFDVYALEDIHYTDGVQKLRTGIALDLPKGYGAVIRGRSSMDIQGFKVSGEIDPHYTGEVFIILDDSHVKFDAPDEMLELGDLFSKVTGYKLNEEDYKMTPSHKQLIVKAGDRIAQFRLVKQIPASIGWVDEIPDKERGSNGFGSSGR